MLISPMQQVTELFLPYVLHSPERLMALKAASLVSLL